MKDETTKTPSACDKVDELVGIMVINMETISSFPWMRERWQIRSYDGSVLAKIIPWDESGCRHEDHANINVMTASPCLYQELKYAVECIDAGCMPNIKWLERAKQAINTAEGVNSNDHVERETKRK